MTVVLPTYNRPDYLRAALGSAVAQQYTNLEIIVADDGSDARTAEVVRAVGDPRVVYRRNATNMGMLQNVVSAIRAARGAYVTTLHDDDVWGERLVAALVPPLERDPSLVVSFADHYVIDAAGNVQSEATEENSRRWGRADLAAGVHRPFYDLALIRQALPVQIAALIRKDAVEWSDFPAEAATVYDLWLYYLLCRDGGGAYYHDERLAYYRVHAGSETATGRLRTGRAKVFCCGQFLQDPRLRSIRPALARKYAVQCRGFGLALVRAGQSAEARSILRRGVSTRFTLAGAAALAIASLPSQMARVLLP